MKALRVTMQPNGELTIAPLPLPAERRHGVGEVEHYRRQARGEMPIGNYGPEPGDFLRSITLLDGRFEGLATQPGSLLTYVISGELTLMPGSPQACQLQPGDIFLMDGSSAPKTVLDVRDGGRLVQIGVASDWPRPEAQLLDAGTPNPRGEHAPNFKRIHTSENEKAYFTEFPEIFSDPPGQWSIPRPILGFRVLTWVDGSVDFHPNVVNQMGIILAGQLDLEASGDGRKESFRPGDICLTEDITGVGHRNRALGIMRVSTIVIPTEHLWSWPRESASPESATLSGN
jgi:hypothetical protein